MNLNKTKMKKTLLLIMFLVSGTFIYSQVTHTVNAGAYYYEPSELTINQGDIVIWINDGGLHDVNGEINSITNESFDNPESFDSPSMSMVGGEIYTHTFNIAAFLNPNFLNSLTCFPLPIDLFVSMFLDLQYFAKSSSVMFEMSSPVFSFITSKKASLL